MSVRARFGIIFGTATVLLTALLVALLPWSGGLFVLPIYLLVINFVTLIAYAYDKAIAGRSGLMRVPEQVLHGLALAGGSPGALFAQRWLRHKTVKTGFRQIYWAIVVLQILLIVALITVF